MKYTRTLRYLRDDKEVKYFECYQYEYVRVRNYVYTFRRVYSRIRRLFHGLSAKENVIHYLRNHSIAI